MNEISSCWVYMQLVGKGGMLGSEEILLVLFSLCFLRKKMGGGGVKLIVAWGNIRFSAFSDSPADT